VYASSSTAPSTQYMRTWRIWEHACSTLQCCKLSLLVACVVLQLHGIIMCRYDYTMDIAPEGREGLFGAIAAAPLFLAKLPTGVLSGFLLEQFCPIGDDGGCSSSSTDVCPKAGSLSLHSVAPVVQSRTLLAAGPASTYDDLTGTGAGTCHPWLWAIVGFVTMTTPLLITIFQSCLRPTAAESSGYRNVDADSNEMQLVPEVYEHPVQPHQAAGLDTVVEGSQELGSFSGLSATDMHTMEQISRERQHGSGPLPTM
jgi:hypothetical protein